MTGWNVSGENKASAQRGRVAVSRLMSIHPLKVQVLTSAAFWNYFQYGVDFLISAEGLVQKILLHSNIVGGLVDVSSGGIWLKCSQPGTPHFQRHARCPWSLPTPSGLLHQASPLAAFRAFLNGESPDHLQVPIPSSSAPSGGTHTTGSKKSKKHRNPSPSATSDTSDSSEVKSSGFVKSSGSSKVDGEQGEGEGMILDRVVEGGLDGVEGMSPSRQ